MSTTTAWVEVDADGNPVADANRAEGLCGVIERAQAPVFTAPALDRGAGAALPVHGPGPGLVLQ